MIPALIIAAAAATTSPDFVREVKPIFEKHCYECHGAEKQKGGLRLDAKAHALKGGEEHKPLWLAGKSTESVIVRFVSGQEPDKQMPPKGEKLSAAEIETLRRWIDAGAHWPDDGVVLNDPLKTHWAFQPLAGKEQGARTMDDFVLEKLKASGLAMSAPADARTLIRRLCLDLTGLPPTPEQVAEFASAHDQHPESSIQNLVTKLLDSPRYGERWARHWLDVVRFAETDGLKRTSSGPTPGATATTSSAR